MDDSFTSSDKMIHVSNIPEGTNEEKLIIHFQRTKNGGCGDIENVELTGNGEAVICFEEAEVVGSVISHNPHYLNKSDIQPLHVQSYREYLKRQQQSKKIFDSATAKVSYDTLHQDMDMNEFVKRIEERGISCHQACDGLIMTGDIDQIISTREFILGLLNSRAASHQHGGHSSNTSRTSKKSRGGLSARNGGSGRENNYMQEYSVEPKLIKYMQQYCKEDLNKITSESRGVIFRWCLDDGKVVLLASNTHHTSKEREQVADEFVDFYQKLFQRMKLKTFEAERMGIEPADMKRALKLAINDSETKIIFENQNGVDTVYGEEEAVDEIVSKLNDLLGLSAAGRSNNDFKHPRGATAYENSSGQRRLSSGQVLSTTLRNGVKLSVCQGDITSENTDAIVNPANSKLCHGAGVAGAIVKAGGYEIQAESDRILRRHNGSIDDGDAVVTGAGKLPCKKVIHAVGPMWSAYNPERSIRLLHRAVISIFNRASESRLTSVSIPAISSGLFGMPKEVCARVLFEAVEEYANKVYPEIGGVTDIRFVNNDDWTVEVFQKEFRSRYGFHDSPVPSSSPAANRSQSASSQTNNEHIWNTSALKKGQKLGHGRGRGIFNREVLDGRPGTIGAWGREDKVKDTETKAYSDAVKGKSSASFQPSSKSNTATETRDDECPICLEKIKDPKILHKCNHKFCGKCIDQAFQMRQRCPLCNITYGTIQGNMPTGTMTSRTHRHNSLPGYEDCGTIEIQYSIPGGRQDHTHPNPGQYFNGTSRTGYLPDNREGREVLELLKKAFDARLTFTVGTSVTTGATNQVVWNDIHHKTNTRGGPSGYGYPDADYLRRVKEDLAAKGIQ